MKGGRVGVEMSKRSSVRGGGALRYFLDLYSGWAAVRKLWGHKWTRGQFFSNQY